MIIFQSLLNLLASAAPLYMAAGVALGIFLGALPGFGATLGIALLIPFTFGTDPALALPMLAGIYCGAIYGGSITAVMVGIPGTSASAATVADGFVMTRKGESNRALSGAGFGTGVLSLLQQWEKPQNVGHFFIAIDPTVFMPPDEFYRRSDGLFSELKNSTLIDPGNAILYPGEIEAAAYDRAMESGIAMDRSAWDSLGKLARGEYDIEVPRR